LIDFDLACCGSVAIIMTPSLRINMHIGTTMRLFRDLSVYKMKEKMQKTDRLSLLHMNKNQKSKRINIINKQQTQKSHSLVQSLWYHLEIIVSKILFTWYFLLL